MLGTLLRRVTIKTLDAVVDKGRTSEHAPLRVAASALDRVRGVVGLDEVQPQAPVPAWSGGMADQPMWESDRRKLHKHRLERGIIREDDAGPAGAATTPAAATGKPQQGIKVYYKRGCPYARAAMELLREREIPFEEQDVKGDETTLSWLKIVTKQSTTPQIFIHGEAIGGFEELRALDQSGELRQRLGEAVGVPAGDEQLVDELEVEELRSRVDAGADVRLVDVRTAEEVAQGMIRGALHLPLHELDARHGELDLADVWVVYCKSGRRSATAVQALRGHGFRSVVSLRGGVEAWTAAGGAVVSPQEAAPQRRHLPVLHPEKSPFEGLAVADAGGVSEGLEGDALVARVREVLDECRPLVQADGGDIELLDVQGGVVHLRLTGNCVGCPSSQATLKQGIERRLKSRIPQISGIASPQLA
jgi:rhodanese-related sulfurtransferase/Fe-S cluster biogenesis protein NfuA/glutaredoxin